MQASVPPSADYPRMTMNYVDEEKSRAPVKGNKWWLVLPLLIPAFFLWIWAVNPMIVVVDGFGEIEAMADTAVLSYSMVGFGADPAAAIAAVNGQVGTSEAVLTASGIVSSDISKSSLQVLPTNTGNGYQAVVTVGAKTSNAFSTDELITQLYQAGAAAVSQPILSVSDSKPYEERAYEFAVKDATAKASQIGLNRLKLIRKVTGISASQTSSVSTSTKVSEENATTTGTFKISQSVTISYKMW